MSNKILEYKNNFNKYRENYINNNLVNYLQSDEAFNSFENIVSIFNKTLMKDSFRYIIKFYVGKYKFSNNNINNNFNLPINKYKNTNEDIVNLKKACEMFIYNNINNNNNNNNNILNNIVKSKNIIKIVGLILLETINDIFSYRNWDLNYKELYMITILDELFKDHINGINHKKNANNEIIISNNEHTKNLLISAYFITKKIINDNIGNNGKNDLILKTETLYTHTQDLDLSFLTREHLNMFKHVLNTKRTIYVRILLVLSEFLLNEQNIINKQWVNDKLTFNTVKDLTQSLKNIMIEIIIIYTGNSIKNYF